MKKIDAIKLSPKASIKEALGIIDSGAVKIALVVDERNHLLGTITDGDIRRAILNGKSIENSIEGVYFTEPTVVSVDESKDSIINICTTKKIYQVPILDNEGRVVGIAMLDELLKPKKYPNKVVLMVGGLGTRLRPLTETTPKPMLHVGGKPILQTIVERFAAHGFTDIVMCVNYKADIIRDYFGDGSRFGVKIEYILENKRMGTAGALSLLKERPKEPFFIMNGDLLTNVNFENMLQYHLDNEAAASMCVREYHFQVPYGVVHIENGRIKSIEEKPMHKFFVSAGIYMLNPEYLDLIPKDEYYDMPTLFEKLIERGENAISFPLREYWLDIGQMEEYERANREYFEVFS
ncbi:nucleotidyltransferase family protein [Hydrogenimonas cancrithermarum]|uniref:Alcohol dehydrogenase n=1 Tax=Hydrogenimonas cancrithermarum TaxID=2993563 RepID=A0ABN6WX27_9BACT|nr:nucleotidyltransferase family protein [Hydrogenimonas cancrithermarum]BDY13558.1 alcohol dehydrogenase [Hydrogenimonas cancrithermarum]